MRRVILIVLVCALVGCGGGGLEGVLAWDDDPVVTDGSVSGRVRNTTSHSVDLNPKTMRLLDDRGRKVPGRIRVGDEVLAVHASTALRATWKSGKPVRIDYGAGALPLTSE